MSDKDALLAAIIREPAEDAPRLAFADLLDEAGEAERAEFIRVQIQIARTPPNKLFCDKSGPLSHAGGSVLFTPRCRCGACSLVRREYRLWSRHEIEWSREALAEAHEQFRAEVVRSASGYSGFVWDDSQWAWLFSEDAVVFRRGFVERVRCPLSAWLKHGPAIVRAHPVMAVEVTDRVPLKPSGIRAYCWLRLEYADTRHRLPADVFDLLPVADPPAYVSAPGGVYATEAAAYAALSDALLVRARAA